MSDPSSDSRTDPLSDAPAAKLDTDLPSVDSSVAFGMEASSPQVDEDFQNSPTLDPPLLRTPPISAKGVSDTSLPEKIGKYKVVAELGRGGFGVVYQADDPDLKRTVAIKVPKPEKLPDREKSRQLYEEVIQHYLDEARKVATLRHPGIVAVFDSGRMESGPWYIVYDFIAGTDLRSHLNQGRLPHRQAAEWTAAVADALHHAHQRGLVHRDIKPENILIDTAGNPHVADFGLALKDEDFGRDFGGGTPAYMSPEQVRGEGHRVDGRTDIFSLGVVLYELLTAQRPFRGDTLGELQEQIASVEAKPPRMIDDVIPKELQRICLKALSKRATDRYPSADEMADDLREYLRESQALNAERPNFHEFGDRNRSRTRESSDPPRAAAPTPAAAARSDSDSRPLKIVPKGLRSFDAGDKDFFLELLPGPHDRNGLPEGLRFWKTKVEQPEADETFAVGLIYGPSGCGKSSLVKAGLLPLLADHVTAVYVEATTDDTESWLLTGLRKRCPTLRAGANLTESFAALRRGQALAPGQKLLIVLDQFEQWLHATKEDEHTELVQALRQCDGGRVQCIVMVRDDFWMAATRFMRALEIRLLEGHNSAAVDLFDTRHARKVLAAFGRAYGALPEATRELTKDQNTFLDRAVDGLAEDGKVVCVRLALFADMVKAKPWVPATLHEMGGMEGVGVTFLEETFSAKTAPPEHRLHQKAARGLLKALLPEHGTDIKGHLRSSDVLREASGYANRPQDFDDLLRILDSELRLITPTEAESGESRDESQKLSASSRASGSQLSTLDSRPSFYQLTHDYLVPSLRGWLTRKQRETRRGRAELRLAERAALWNTKPESRHLPSVWEWLRITLLTRVQDWTAPQRKMMRKAGRVHGLRGLIALMTLLAVGFVAWQFVSAQQRYVAVRQLENDRKRAESLVDAILAAPADAVPYAIEKIQPLSDHALPLLREKKNTAADRRQQLHAAFALAALGEADVDFLIQNIKPDMSNECRNFSAALRSVRASAEVTEQLLRKTVESKDSNTKVGLAAVAIYLGDARAAQQLLQLRPDPIDRTLFIDQFASWRSDLVDVPRLLKETDDAAFRSGMCAALGNIPVAALLPSEKEALSETLLQLYRGDGAGSVHSAAGWALRQWQMKLPEIEPSQEPLAGSDWYVNRSKMSMLKIPAGSFTRVDEGSAEKPKQSVTLTGSFFLSDREVSVGQFREFMDDAEYKGEKPTDWKGEYESVSPSRDHPVLRVNWYDAVMFCNWLSNREGLAACYQGSGTNWKLDGDAAGYRLPTEAQWEYACRAGTTSEFAYGDDEAMLGKYAVFLASKTKVCGSKLPNGWGLFDMHGNVWEWCEDWYNENRSGRVLRGGSFDSYAILVRSAYRNSYLPGYRFGYSGFRVARTYN